MNTGYNGQWLPLRLLELNLPFWDEPDSPLRNRNRNIIPWVAFF